MNDEYLKSSEVKTPGLPQPKELTGRDKFIADREKLLTATDKFADKLEENAPINLGLSGFLVGGPMLILSGSIKHMNEQERNTSPEFIKFLCIFSACAIVATVIICAISQIHG